MTANILRLPEVKARTGQSRSTIYMRIAEGTFPKQVRLGGVRSVGWLESEISDWIESCVAERDALAANDNPVEIPARRASCSGGAHTEDAWKPKRRARSGAET